MAAAGVDVPPTRAGYEWRCRACPFRTVDLAEAREHVLTSRAAYDAKKAPWPHDVLECPGGDVTKKAARWIYTMPLDPQVMIGPYQPAKGRKRGSKKGA